MKIQEQINLKFHGMSILDLHCTSTQQYNPAKEKISMHITPKVFYPKDLPLQFQILMDVVLEAKDYFSMKVFGVGAFSFDNDISDEDIKKSFISVNAPAIMFPYMRSFIHTLSVNLGASIGAISIPPQFFSGNLEEITEDGGKNIHREKSE